MNDLTFQTTDFTDAVYRQMATLHRSELGEGFLTSLGDRPLRLIFAHFAESRYGVLVVALDQDRVAGFVCGATDTSAFFRDFIVKWFGAALVIFLPRLLRIRTFIRALETLTYPARQDGQLPAAELMDIVVQPSHQRQGLGEKLYLEFIGSMRNNGVRQFRVGTNEKLVGAQRFYEKMGARRVSSLEIHKGETSYYYQQSIED